MSFSAVIFDMDGVIIDTEHYSHMAWRALAREDGLGDIDDMYFEAMGRNEREISASWIERFGYDGYPDFFQRVLRWHEENSPEGFTPLRDGAREVLAFLKDRGIPIALASGTSHDLLMERLENNRITAYFDVIWSGDMVEHCKPDPALFLGACNDLGVDPARTYGVEDSRKGIQALHAAGMRPILAEDQYHPSEEIVSLCEAVLPSMYAVRDYLERKLQ